MRTFEVKGEIVTVLPATFIVQADCRADIPQLMSEHVNEIVRVTEGTSVTFVMLSVEEQKVQ